jgi:4'-phosphopantetheinyl transferase
MPPETITLRPVILAVPPMAVDGPAISPRVVNQHLSRTAREALAHSARRSNCRLILTDLAKDDRGAPLPMNGLYWSLTHKPSYVGGVVAGAPVGMDIEAVRSIGDPLFHKVASTQEWARCDENRQHCFFRYWTAKEAALKATGAGIRDLGHCKIAAVHDRRRLQIAIRHRQWMVDQLFFDGHVAAVASPPGCRVRWLIRKPAPADNG